MRVRAGPTFTATALLVCLGVTGTESAQAEQIEFPAVIATDQESAADNTIVCVADTKQAGVFAFGLGEQTVLQGGVNIAPQLRCIEESAILAFSRPLFRGNDTTTNDHVTPLSQTPLEVASQAKKSSPEQGGGNS